MSEDLFSRAARALRDGHDGASPQAAATRRTVLALTAARRRRRTAFAAVWMPLAAVLVVSSAWAAVTGRLPALMALLRGSATLTPSARPTMSGSASTPLSPTPPSTPTATATATPTSPAPSTVEDSLYAAAHRAHFVSHDPAAALAAWDAYLSSFPAGRFAPEARYNRALALVRLGRLDEARSALAPFAEGAAGAYRKKEARELLDALDSGR